MLLGALLATPCGAENTAARPISTVVFWGNTVSRSDAVEYEQTLDRVGASFDRYLATDEDDRAAAWLTVSASLDQLLPEIDPESKQTARLAGLIAITLCDGDHSKLLAQRSAWSERLMATDQTVLSDLPFELSEPLTDDEEKSAADWLKAIVDGWALRLAVHAGCSDQALDYANAARSTLNTQLARASLDLSLSGLLLERSVGRAASLRDALQLRERAFKSWREALNALAASRSETRPWNEYSFGGWIEFALEQSAKYDVEFRRLVKVREAPQFRVNPSQSALLRPRNTHGFGTWMIDAMIVLATPNWPSATNVLVARGDGKAAATFALADLFGTPDSLHQGNRAAWGLDLDNAAAKVVGGEYGGKATKAELERAAASIRLSAPTQGLAIATIFGHEILLESGEVERGSAGKTTWYTLEQIQANFRKSSAYQALTEETNSPAAPLR